eukprot:CAMPEP_0204393202 /NCGR_PEP_ID=MMETSP0469-20131031/62193_1 /ASSEMBLY_ACC=CAM_ASM_000384 /TAXON_ID=2969 /ORGANISM="Oxyrrhis marina" /LENGTH=105 /DNA_ID=CAMNT_0051387257 /DNA_START=1054 /DNA_END=1371 /DNA_ORIENTATION=+
MQLEDLDDFWLKRSVCVVFVMPPKFFKQLDIKIFEKDGPELAVLKMPAFCVDHMKKMPADKNLEMVKKHIKQGTKRDVTTVYVNGVAKTTMQLEDLDDTCKIEID